MGCPGVMSTIGYTRSVFKRASWGNKFFKNKIVMGKRNFVPCLDVIMIAFYPRNSTVKNNTSFFGVSTILTNSFFFFCILESLSDFFL